MSKQAKKPPRSDCKFCHGRGFLLHTMVNSESREVVPCRCVYREPNMVKDGEDMIDHQLSRYFKDRTRKQERAAAKREAKDHRKAMNSHLLPEDEISE